MPISTVNDRLLSVREVAALLGVGPGRVRQLIATRRLPARKVEGGRDNLIAERDLALVRVRIPGRPPGYARPVARRRGPAARPAASTPAR